MSAALALIIAADRYDDPGLRRLRGPAQDAAALDRVLADPTIGGFTVRTVVNEPAHMVNEEIEAFFAERLRDDLMLLYMSCHGVKDDNGRLYFASSNTKLRRLAATAVSSIFVSEQMDQCRSRKVVLLLDCCYSGAFARGMVPRAAPAVDVHERFDGRGRVVITASTAMEYAFEVDGSALSGSGTPSLFTGAVVRGLHSGDADRDGDGRISVDELYDYVYESVRSASPDQTPSMVSHVQGDLYIATSSRTSAAPRHAPMPAPPAPAPPAPAPPAPAPPAPEPPPPARGPGPSNERRRRATAAALVAVAAAVVALIAVILANRPASAPTSGGGTPSPSATTSPSGVLTQGTTKLTDPAQGFDLVSGATVAFFSSHIAWDTQTKRLFVFDETTLGAVNLGRVPFADVTSSRLAALEYGQGSANPALPASAIPAGTVLAVHVSADTYAKLQIVSPVTTWSSAGSPTGAGSRPRPERCTIRPAAKGALLRFRVAARRLS